MGQDPQGQAATTLAPLQNGAFQVDRPPGGEVGNRRQEALGAGIAGTAVDGHRALGRSRGTDLPGIEGHGFGGHHQAEAVQAGHGQQGRLDFTALHLGDAGIDVATNRGETQVRPAGGQLGLPAQTAGANEGTFGEFIEGSAIGRNEGVTDIGPGRGCHQSQTFGFCGRQILAGMDARIGPAVKDGRLDFAHEHANRGRLVEGRGTILIPR